DVGTIKIPNGLTDEQVLFLSDIFPTGYMAAENCNIQPGDTVAVWGCGPVGQFAIRSAFLLGAERVFAIDRFPERLHMAEEGHAETINYEVVGVYDTLMENTGGLGPDSCIDAVGLEAHVPGVIGAYDRVKQAMMLESDRPHVFRQALLACRKGCAVCGAKFDFPSRNLMIELIESVEHHVEEEESEMFPKVRQVFDQGQLEQL